MLTAREFLTKGRALSRTLDQVLRALRKRWPVEWFCRWEEQDRGALHVNLLVKGVPVDQWEEFQRVLVGRWCDRVDAEPAGQYVEPIECGEAVTVYVANKVEHAGKSNQEPTGWRFKHRTSQTRGYLVRPAGELRTEARRSLAAEALVWRGWTREAAALEVGLRAEQMWSLRSCSPWSSAPADVRVGGPEAVEAVSPPGPEFKGQVRPLAAVDGAAICAVVDPSTEAGLRPAGRAGELATAPQGARRAPHTPPERGP